MAYVPRKRNINLPFKWIVFIVVILLFISGGIYLYVQKQAPQEAFAICGLNEQKSGEKINVKYKDTYTISDYFFYGESLDLFASDYVLGEKDDMSRKSVELVNLCSGDTTTYTMEAYVNRQIDVSELADGFYEIYVNDNLVKKRLVYDETLTSDPFTTIKREDEVKSIRLLADQDLLSEEQGQLDQDYVFMEVETTTPKDDMVDVFIDPYGYMTQNGLLEQGNIANDLVEYEVMYDAAVQLKEKLESYGLRVAISKQEAKEDVPYYGKDGRMERAYASKARYYIELGLNASTQSAYRGTEIYHSAYAAETFANSFMYELKKNTELVPSNAYTCNERSEGVASASLAEGIDGLKVYDAMPAIRESGGRATGAAKINEAASANTSFSQGHEGMQAISVNLFYISNSEDVAYWKEHKETIIDGLAKAFVKTIRLTESES